MLNLDATQIMALFAGRSLGYFFIKSFGVVFSLLFTVYAVVTYKQVQEITRSVLDDRNRFILLYSLIQIVVGVALLLYAIFLI